MASARDRGLLAGHRCYEGKPYEDNPYATGTQEDIDWLNAFTESFNSAESNDT